MSRANTRRVKPFSPKEQPSTLRPRKFINLAAFGLVVSFSLAFWALAALFFFFKSPEKLTPNFDFPPQQVRISNVTSRGFTLSWVTQIPTTGTVVFSESRQLINKKDQNLKTAFDQRGEPTLSKTHFVDLENLGPKKTYFFLIKSGSTPFFKTLEGKWEKKGLPSEQKTTSEDTLSLDWITGLVLKRNSQPVPGVFVYLEIPGKSSLLSALTNENGEWRINLANLMQKDLSQPLRYNPQKDLLRLTVEGPDGERISSYQQIPSFIKRDSCNLPADCSKTTPEITPIIIEFEPPNWPTAILTPNSILRN